AAGPLRNAAARASSNLHLVVTTRSSTRNGLLIHCSPGRHARSTSAQSASDKVWLTRQPFAARPDTVHLGGEHVRSPTRVESTPAAAAWWCRIERCGAHRDRWRGDRNDRPTPVGAQGGD